MKESEILKNYDRTSKDVLAMESADTKDNVVPTMKMEDAHIEEPVKAEVGSAIDEVIFRTDPYLPSQCFLYTIRTSILASSSK